MDDRNQTTSLEHGMASSEVHPVASNNPNHLFSQSLLPDDVIHEVSGFCTLEARGRWASTCKANQFLIWRAIRSLKLDLGSVTSHTQMLKYFNAHPELLPSLTELKCRVQPWSAVQNLYVFIAKFGARLRRVQIIQGRMGRKLEASSIIPFINSSNLETLHVDCDCCVPLMVMLRNGNAKKLREFVLPIHSPESNDSCVAADLRTLGLTIAEATGKLEVLYISSARDLPYGISQHSKEPDFLAPIVSANQQTLKYISFDQSTNAFAWLFPPFTKSSNWTNLPEKCLSTFNLPLSMFRFHRKKFVQGVSNLISAAAEFIRSNRPSSEQMSHQNLQFLFQECYKRFSDEKSDELLRLKACDLIAISQTVCDRDDATIPMQWIVESAKKILPDLFSRHKSVASHLLLSIARTKACFGDAAMLEILKPYLLEIDSLFFKMVDNTDLHWTAASPKLFEKLLEDPEWCSRARVDINACDSKNRSLIRLLFEHPSLLAKCLRTFRDQISLFIAPQPLLKSTVPVDAQPEQRLLLEEVWDQLSENWHWRDVGAPVLEAVYEIYAASENSRAMVWIPSQKRQLDYLLARAELRRAIACALPSLDAILDLKLIRCMCFDTDEAAITTNLNNLKEMLEEQHGRQLEPELVLQVADTIWMRVLGAYKKSEDQLREAAKAILTVFPVAPERITRFVSGATDKPLKSAEKIILARRALKSAFEAKKITFSSPTSPATSPKMPESTPNLGPSLNSSSSSSVELGWQTSDAAAVVPLEPALPASVNNHPSENGVL